MKEFHQKMFDHLFELNAEFQKYRINIYSSKTVKNANTI